MIAMLSDGYCIYGAHNQSESQKDTMDMESIKVQFVLRRNHHRNSSHRDRTSSFHCTVSPASPSFLLALTVRGPITLPDLVDAHIRDRSRALVCKPSKWKCLACLQNFVSVHLVLEQWIRLVLHLPEQEATSEESHQSWPTFFVCLMLQGTRRPSAGISLLRVG